MFFRTVLYGIVGLMMVGGVSLAAADKPVQKKGSKPYVCTTKQAEAGECLPVAPPAKVGPDGRIENFNSGFGESVAKTPAQAHRQRLKWGEMEQKEIDELTAALKKIKDKKPTAIVCKDPMCEDLALNLDNAFESAKWKSEIVIGTVFGVPEGFSVSSKWLADAINDATYGRYGAKVEEVRSIQGGGEYVLIGAKPRARGD